jgi:ABC-type Zn uptake system ZnuABC Zn-binding protein ZnuA
MLTVFPSVAATLRVITTTTDLKSLVESVGGERVTVTSLAPAGLNAETFQPRPQDLERLRAADLVVRIGLDYDLWVDPLLRKTGRNELRRGGAAHVDASQGIAMLEVRTSALDAASGHGHGGGNPHYWLDPHNAEIMSASLVDGLRRVDPGNANTYEANHKQFIASLRARQRDWDARLAPLSGKPVIGYHDSWAYFARRFRLRIVDLIEPKPGISPSPARLAGLITHIRTTGVVAILRQPFDPDAAPNLLAQKTGVPVVTLASSVGAVPEVRDYLGMMDYNVRALERVTVKTK